MFRLFAIVVVWAAMFWHPVAALAHGVGSREIDPGAAKAMVFLYADGEPMAFAQVLVTTPGTDGTVYQSGRADGRGQFAFVPSGPGIWAVAASDGQGHRAVRQVTVDDAAAPAPMQTAPAAAQPISGLGPGWREVTLGLSLLANMALAATLWRRKSG